MARRQSKDPLEYAKTPAWAVRRLFEHPWSRPLRNAMAYGWIDRCAGDGGISDAVAGIGLRPASVELDKNPRRTRVFRGDGLLDVDMSAVSGVVTRFGAIVENPPFSVTGQFVLAGARTALYGAYLQRLNWIVGSERQGLFELVGRPDTLTLPDRPSFTGDGATDGQEYAWHLFGLEGGRIDSLASTPLSERKAEYWRPRKRRKSRHD